MEPPKPQEGHDGWPIAGASRSDVSDPGSRLPLLPRRELPPLPDLDDELLKLDRSPPPPPPESKPASSPDFSLELGLPGLVPEGPRRLDPPVPGRRELPPLPDLDEELQRLEAEPEPLPKLETSDASLFPESKLPPLPDLDEELKRLEGEPVLNLGGGLFPESALPPLPDLEEELRRLEEVPSELGPLKPVSEEERFRSLPPLPNLEDELRLLDPVVESEPKQLPPLPDLSLELQRLESEQPKAPPLPAARLDPPASRAKKSEAFEFPSLFGDEPEPVAEETPPEPPAKPALGLPSFFDAKSKSQPEKPKVLEPPPPLEAPTPSKPKMLEPPPPLEETSAPRSSSFLNQKPAVPEPPSLFSDPPVTESQPPSLFGARAEEPAPATFLTGEPPSLFADKPSEPEPPSFLTAQPEPPSLFPEPATDPPPAAGGLFGEPIKPAGPPLAEPPSLFDEPAAPAAKPQRARQPEPPSLFGEPEPAEPEAFDEPAPGIIIDDDTYDDTVCVGDLDRDAVPMIRSARGFTPPAAKEPPPPPPPKKERLKFDPATAPVAERANPFETSQMKVVFPQAQAPNPRETSEMKVVAPGQKPVNVFETSKMKVIKPDSPAPEGVRSTTQITELREEQKKGRAHVMTAAAAVADREAPPRPPPKPAKRVSAADTGESTTFVKGHFKAMLGSDGPKASREDIAILTRQMAAMIAAGIPVHSTLEFCIDGESKLSPVMEDIAIKVSSGIALSHAMRDYPRVFDQVFIGLVQTGEMSGQLSEIFLKLAELLERQVAMKKKVVAALTYPVILMTVATIGVMGFVYFVLPTITPLFESMKIDLPLPTRILIMSRRGIPIAFFGTLLVALEIWIFRPYWERELRKRHEFRRKLHSIPLRLPMIGQTVEKVITSRVLYAMASMLDVGIGMAQALARAENAAGNEFVAHRLRLARGDLADGMTVYECLSAHEVFPPGALQLISVGEESADLAKMFKYVARYYEEEVEYSLATLTSMLEPMIMLVMGIVVGFITLSAAMPTIKLLQTIS